MNFTRFVLFRRENANWGIERVAVGVGSVGGYWVILLCGIDGRNEFKDDLETEGELLGCFVAGI